MSLRKCMFLGVGIFAYSGGVSADFSVQANDWPQHQGKYGYSYNEDFYDAVSGRVEMTPKEEKDLEEMLPSIVEQRWYLRYGINVGEQKLSKVENKSRVTATRALPVTHKDARINEKPSQIAVGYNSSVWHVEFEYLLGDTIKYTHDPVLTGSADSLISTVTGDTIFVNGYYDITNKSVIRPYLMGGVGLAFNKTNTRLNNGASNKKVVYEFAYNFGAGFRLHFINPAWMSNFFIDANYRFYILNKAVWEGADDDFRLQAKRGMRGFGLSLTYVF